MNTGKKLTSSSNKLVRIIKKSKKILIATHIDPDADGICAALSCSYLVTRYKKHKPALFCYSPIPAKYNFLLGNQRFTRSLPEFDLLIAVDSAGISRIFPNEKYLKRARLDSKVVANIDHHKSNDAFGIFKIIEENVSSACEIIYEIFKKLRIPVSRQLADIFFCGIYSETGGFVYPNTTEESLKIAGELVGFGVKTDSLVKKMNAKTLSGTILLSKVLNTIEIADGIGMMHVTQRMLKSSHARMADSENFVSFLNAINNVHIAVFLREEKDGVRISLRSDGIIDVDELARRFGGGGHRLAAGVRIKMDLREAKQTLLKTIRRALDRRRHGV
jgi:phosphoesterase RecJ-like protein